MPIVEAMKSDNRDNAQITPFDLRHIPDFPSLPEFTAFSFEHAWTISRVSHT
jgi:hypothetical protein